MRKTLLTLTLACAAIFCSAQNFMVVTVQAPTEEMMDNLTVGVGYSFVVWKGLAIEPNYSLGLKEDANGDREGTFNLGLAYRF